MRRRRATRSWRPTTGTNRETPVRAEVGRRKE
jgi:hypothetical protein